MRLGRRPKVGVAAGPGTAPLAGEAVVFDLDGVLSDAAARQHYIKAPA